MSDMVLSVLDRSWSVECSALLFIAVLIFASDKISSSELFWSAYNWRSESAGVIKDLIYGTLFLLINKLK